MSGGLFKNRYKIPEDKFNEIAKMGDKELGELMERYYVNWITNTELKKSDPTINSIKIKKKNLSDEIESSKEIVELKEKLKKLRLELTTEEKARLDEELKNESKEVNADIQSFKALFQTCADLKTKRVIQDN